MKKINTYYWICTGLFGAFMMFSAIPNILLAPESVELINTQLGYPLYFTPFIGVAKAFGVIGILIPGFPRIKEWAYAGLFFDLFSAVYSGIMVNGFDPMMLTLLVPVGIGGLSYYFHHERMKAANA